MSLYSCPVCSSPLAKSGQSFLCEHRHCFDKAKEGYVNLLLSNQHSSKSPGDSDEMATARHKFLSNGYYGFLADKLSEIIRSLGAKTVLDACCGEGFYCDRVQQSTDALIYAFDISKPMVKLAAKRNSSVNCFVAGLNSIPVQSAGFDAVMHVFAPFNESEFSRVIKADGCVISVTPGREHLWELKELLYESPYYNAEKSFCSSLLRVDEQINICNTLELSSAEDIANLFKMTPYYYKSSADSLQKIAELSSLSVKADFTITIYRHIS